MLIVAINLNTLCIMPLSPINQSWITFNTQLKIVLCSIYHGNVLVNVCCFVTVASFVQGCFD